jgi:hypothetical protein
MRGQDEGIREKGHALGVEERVDGERRRDDRPKGSVTGTYHRQF